MDENIISDLNDELESVLEEGHSALRKAELEEKLKEVRTEAELFIRKYPIASVAIGTITGYFIGRLFR